MLLFVIVITILFERIRACVCVFVPCVLMLMCVNVFGVFCVTTLVFVNVCLCVVCMNVMHMCILCACVCVFVCVVCAFVHAYINAYWRVIDVIVCVCDNVRVRVLCEFYMCV